MTKSKHPSILDGDKTLSLELIADCYKQFIEGFKDVAKLPQVKLEQTNKEINVYFKSRSQSYVVVSPSVVITDTEACAGFEKYRTISITAHNCGLCKGTKAVTFDARTIHKFLITLEIARKLFIENYEKAMITDKEQLEWQQVVSLSESLVGINKRNTQPDGKGYTESYLFNVQGSISDNDTAKNFDMRLENLTPQQVAKIGKVLKDL